MAITKSGGQTIVPSADLADITADVNLPYPNGIGKRKGMEVVRDTGTVLQKAIARGDAADDIWDIVGDGAAAIAVTPA
jgi:hypothetical protein